MIISNRMKKMRDTGKQSGSIFTILMGALAVTAALSLSTYQLLSGPVATMARISKNTLIEERMKNMGAMTVTSASSTDCDGDTEVEPVGWRVATGNAPTNGGWLPTSLGLPTIDPWGNEYGYCVWDTGATIQDAACGAPSYRLDGSPDTSAGAAKTQTVFAFISSGPDRQFQTTCNDYVDTATDLITTTGDDVIKRYTYDDAVALAASGPSTDTIWALKAGDSTTAEVGKNIEVTPGAITFVQTTAPTDVTKVDALPNPQDMLSLDLGAMPTDGNAVLVYVSMYFEHYDYTVLQSLTGMITDNQGNAYSLLGYADIDLTNPVPCTSQCTVIAVYGATNIATPNAAPFTITADYDEPSGGSPQGATSWMTMAASEVSGLADAPLDQAATAYGDPSGFTTVTTAATTQIDEVAIGVHGYNLNASAGNDYDIDAGWTEIVEKTRLVDNTFPNEIQAMSVVHKTLSAAAAVSHTWDHSNWPYNGTGGPVGLIVTLKAKKALNVDFATGVMQTGSLTTTGRITPAAGAQLGDETGIADGACTVGNKGLMRYNTNPDTSDLGSAASNGINVVQQSIVNTNDGLDNWGEAVSSDFGQMPTDGNAIIVTVSGLINVGGDGIPTYSDATDDIVTDNQGNTYTRVGFESQADPYEQIFTAIYVATDIGTPNGGTFTVTADLVDTEAAGELYISALEVAGLDYTNLVDETASDATDVSGDTKTTVTSGTTDTADELAVAVMTYDLGATQGNDYLISPNWMLGPLSNRQTTGQEPEKIVSHIPVYRIYAATGIVSHTWTHASNQVNGNWAPTGLLVTFRGAASSTATPAWITPKGFNFRDTESFVTDGANETYVLATAYPRTRTIGGQAVTFGWENKPSNDPFSTDRNAAVDRRLAGVNQCCNTTGTYTEVVFRVDLPAPGAYDIVLAVGDENYNNQAHWIIYDGTTIRANQPSKMQGTSARWFDAAGTLHNEANWVATGSGVSIRRQFDSSVFRFAMRQPGQASFAGSSVIAHISLTQATAGASPRLEVCNGTEWVPAVGDDDRTMALGDGIWTGESNNNIYYASGSVGIGTSSPDAPVHVDGEVILSMQEAVSCSGSADVDGILRYNPYFDYWDYCQGSAWARLTYGGGKKGWFVLGPSVNGNIVSGQGTTHARNAASARCNTHLQANDWLGKAEAQASDMLWSGNVQAFFCWGNADGIVNNSSCYSTYPNTTYYFAKSGDVTKGGASFTTDYLGSGPFNDDDWSDNNHFGSDVEWWGVRDANSLYIWNNLAANQESCATGTSVTTSWNTTAGTADYGKTNAPDSFWTADRKWTKQAAQGNCDAVRYLICMVH